MIESLLNTFETLGLPMVAVLLVGGALVLVREAWSLLRAQREVAYETTVLRLIDELDAKLEKFYLPLRERLNITQHIFQVVRDILVEVTPEPFGSAPEAPGIYIQSADKHVFTNMIERDILIQLNAEIVKLVLDCASYRDSSDNTNYGAFLHHYLLWAKLWEACEKDSIQRFSAVEVIDFPASEAARFLAVCDVLLRKRETLREDALNMRHFSLLARKTTKGDRQ